MSRAIKQSSEKEYTAELEALRKCSKGKLVITCVKGNLLAFLIRDEKTRCITVLDNDSLLEEDIVIAVVRDIKKDIGAAFIEYSEGNIGYLPLNKVPEGISIKQGDLIPVSITARAQKGKRARFTARIDYSKYVSGEELENRSKHLAKYNYLYKKKSSPLSKLSKVFDSDEYDEIITDDKELYELLTGEKINVRLYDDPSFDLSRLYSLETKINEALSQKIWLKCGGYLVFNKTEAMTVIDVNSGKYQPSKGTESEDAFLNVNAEAALEICRQLRIRNISGIIIADFINLKEKKHQDQIMDILKKASSKDHEQVTVVDITALGLIEITRKKGFPPLYEQLNNI